MQDLTFEELVERARADDRVVGLFLGGSRGKGANVRPDSDYDVRLVVTKAEDDFEVAQEYATRRGARVEVAILSFERLLKLPEWMRYELTHTRALVDKNGRVQKVIDEKGRFGDVEGMEVALAAFDGYMNSLYRSLKRPGLAARIHAGESVGHLLTSLFALEGRIRPYHDYLEWELDNHPLEDWSADQLLGLIASALSGEPEPQRELFRRVEPHAQAAGLGSGIDSWEPDVPFMRGEP